MLQELPSALHDAGANGNTEGDAQRHEFEKSLDELVHEDRSGRKVQTHQSQAPKKHTRGQSNERVQQRQQK